MPAACPWSRVTTGPRSTAGGCGGRRSPARLCSSVPCRRRPVPQAVRHGCMGAARSRPLGPSLGGRGAAARRVRRGVGQSGGSPTGCCWRPPGRCSDGGRPAHRRGVSICRGPQGLTRRGGRSRGRAAGVAPASADGGRSGVALRGVSHGCQGRDALAARRCGESTASPTCGGGGGTVPTVACLSQCVAHVHRGQPLQHPPAPPCQARLWRAQGAGPRVPRGGSPEGAPQGQQGPGKPGVGGAAGPNKGLQATGNSLRSYFAPAIPSA